MAHIGTLCTPVVHAPTKVKFQSMSYFVLATQTEDNRDTLGGPSWVQVLYFYHSERICPGVQDILKIFHPALFGK